MLGLELFAVIRRFPCLAFAAVLFGRLLPPARRFGSACLRGGIRASCLVQIAVVTVCVLSELAAASGTHLHSALPSPARPTCGPASSLAGWALMTVTSLRPISCFLHANARFQTAVSNKRLINLAGTAASGPLKSKCFEGVAAKVGALWKTRASSGRRGGWTAMRPVS